MRRRAPRMNDTLGDSLMVEVRDLFAQDEVFQQRAASLASLERVLVVVDPKALIGRQVLPLGILLEGRQVLQ